MRKSDERGRVMRKESDERGRVMRKESFIKKRVIHSFIHSFIHSVKGEKEEMRDRMHQEREIKCIFLISFVVLGLLKEEKDKMR